MFITMPTQTGTTTGQSMRGSPPPPPPSSEEFVQQVKAAIEAGALDVDELEAKLLSALGDDAEGIVSEDGKSTMKPSQRCWWKRPLNGRRNISLTSLAKTRRNSSPRTVRSIMKDLQPGFKSKALKPRVIRRVQPATP